MKISDPEQDIYRSAKRLQAKGRPMSKYKRFPRWLGGQDTSSQRQVIKESYQSKYKKVNRC